MHILFNICPVYLRLPPLLPVISLNLNVIALHAICLRVRYTGFPSTVPLTWPKTKRNKKVIHMMTAKQIQYVLVVYLSARSVSVVEK